MTINAYSTYAAYLTNLSGMQNLQKSLVDLNQQLASNKKSTDLTTYGTESQRLLSLRGDFTRREAYIAAGAAASTEVKAYGTVLDQIETIAADLVRGYSAADADKPVLQKHEIAFDGDANESGAIYRVTVGGALFSYAAQGNEGGFEEIASNLANQINNRQPPAPVTASVVNEKLVITAKVAGETPAIGVSIVNPAGGANTIEASLTTAGKASPLLVSAENTLKQLQALLNEQVNDRYLFSGSNGAAQPPVVDLARLPGRDTGSATSATTQQLAGGTIRQQIRLTVDNLGEGQSETLTINGTSLTITGPLTAQQATAQYAAAIAGAPALAGIAVGDADAEGLTLTAVTPGAAFTANITDGGPTPSQLAIVQANVPIGALQTQTISLAGKIGTIGQVYSITLTDPPAYPSPVTLSVTTTGNEKSVDEIAQALVAQVAAQQPPFSITATQLGDGKIALSASSAFTAIASAGNESSVATTQRTVVPVAQQEQVTFPGPFGDAGDVYAVNLTAPAAGSFSVTTLATDDAASVAAKFVDQINAAGLGVTAVVRSGRLVVTSDVPGTPIALNAALTTDAGNASAAPAVSTLVANISAGATPQTDIIQLGGQVGGIGIGYEITVDGRDFRYTTNGAEPNLDAIALQLAAQINAAIPPLAVTAVPGPVGSGKVVITANAGGDAFETGSTVILPDTVPEPQATAYSAYQSADESQRAWERDRLTIADQLTLKLGISANDPAFQKLIAAVRLAQSAAATPDGYVAAMSKAAGLARDALNGVQALSNSNALNDTLMSATKLAHQTQMNLSTDGAFAIEGIDPNEVAAKIQSAQVQLQAVYSVVGTIGRLSLVNFLA